MPCNPNFSSYRFFDSPVIGGISCSFAPVGYNYIQLLSLLYMFKYFCLVFNTHDRKLPNFIFIRRMVELFSVPFYGVHKYFCRYRRNLPQFFFPTESKTHDFQNQFLFPSDVQCLQNNDSGFQSTSLKLTSLRLRTNLFQFLSFFQVKIQCSIQSDVFLVHRSCCLVQITDKTNKKTLFSLLKQT